MPGRTGRTITARRAPPPRQPQSALTRGVRDGQHLDGGAGREGGLARRDRPPGVGPGQLADRPRPRLAGVATGSRRGSSRRPGRASRAPSPRRRAGRTSPGRARPGERAWSSGARPEGGQQRGREQLEDDRGGQGIAGQPDDRRGPGPVVAAGRPRGPGLAWPSSAGWPGRTATPVTATPPTWASTAAVWSPRPRLDPAMTSTRSAPEGQPRSSAASASGSSGSTSLTCGQRAQLTAARGEHERVGVDDVARPRGDPTGRISSPVGMIATAGRRATAPSRARPPRRRPGRPAAAGGPAGSSTSPAAKSSPSARTCCPVAAPGAVHLSGPRRPATPPSACGSSRSRTTTVSRPAGIGSPVSIHSNAPAGRRTVPSASGPRRSVGGAHGDAVHGGAGAAGRRPAGGHRRGGDPAERLSRPEPARRPCPRQPARERVKPPLVGGRRAGQASLAGLTPGPPPVGGRRRASWRYPLTPA